MTPDLMTPARGDIESALASEHPLDALSSEMKRLLADGWTRPQLLALLEEVRETLRVQQRDSDEDVVLEVMDFLVGWASPGAKI
ncbi:MAG: hypothetical protein WEE66_04020 [Actinomycetota bacterium]